MGYFPFFTNVENLNGVIIGGGAVALEKVERLLVFNAKLTVIAPTVYDEIKALGNQLKIEERKYKKEDFDAADYIIAATNIREVNEEVYAIAKEKKILINVVDVPDKCDFIFPSVLQRGKLVVGVSTSGAGPQVAIRLRDEIEKLVPSDIEEKLDFLARERILAKEKISDPKERRRYLIDLANKVLNDER